VEVHEKENKHASLLHYGISYGGKKSFVANIFLAFVLNCLSNEELEGRKDIAQPVCLSEAPRHSAE
jgi:hypothetical protein